MRLLPRLSAAAACVAALSLSAANAADETKALVARAEGGDVAAMMRAAEALLADGDGKASMAWWRKAAEKGNADAQYEWAQLLHDGTEGLAADAAAAFPWYERAARQGNSAAQYAVGHAYAEGDGVAADATRALEWYRKAADEGSADAAYAAGVMYADGHGVTADLATAVKYLQRALTLADEDHEGASNKIAELKEANADFVAKVVATAPATTRALMQRAEQGDVAAQREVSALFSSGEGGLWLDQEEATRWIRKAAEQGDAESEYRLGKAFAFGAGIEQDAGEAVRWMSKAAEQGYADAAYELGRRSKEGDGVAADPAEAVRWWRIGAEKGSVKAALELGRALRDGDGVAPDRLEAYHWLAIAGERNTEAENERNELAASDFGLRDKVIAAAPAATQDLIKRANADDARAQYELGELFFNGGGGLPRDMQEAVNWYQAAAKAGEPEAEYSVGLCYRWGWQVTADVVNAAAWFRKSADHGHADAQFALGELYRDGKGVEASLDQAAYWWRKAIAQGHAEARKAFEKASAGGVVFKEVAPEVMDEQTVLERRFGKGLPPEVKGETRKYLLMAEAEPNTDAYYHVALAYLQGKPEDGVAKDVPRGEMWMQRAADSRHPEALAYFEEKERAAKAAETAQFDAERRELAAKFDEEFEEAYDFPGQEAAVENFDRAAAAKWRDAATEFVLQQVAIKANAAPEQAGIYVLALKEATLSKATLDRVLSPAARANVTAYARKVRDDYDKHFDERAAMRPTEARARAGDAQAQYDLGVFQLRLAGRDTAEGLDWLRKAAAGGNPAAKELFAKQVKAALEIAENAMRTNDELGALRAYRKAVDFGAGPEAKNSLGWCYRHGWGGGHRKRELGIKLQLEAADAGDSAAQYEIARLYSEGDDMPRDENLAVKYARLAADQGNWGGLDLMARFALNGIGVAQDEDEALRWFRRLAEKDRMLGQPWVDVLDPKAPEDARAQLALANASHTMWEDLNWGWIPGRPEDWLNFAARHGNAEAKRLQGIWHPSKEDVMPTEEVFAGDQAYAKKKPADALQHWQTAATQGSALAKLRLAGLYLTGEGVEEDDAKAATLLQEAGDGGLLAGHVRKVLSEGWDLLKQGVRAYERKEYGAALHFWQAGARLGCDQAMYDLGVLYEKGQGVAADPKEARRWYEQALLFGNDNARALLSPPAPDKKSSVRELLAQGVAARNAHRIDEAIRLFEQAAAAGDTKAMTELGMIYSAGQEVPADVPKALGWYDQAAKLGDDDAATLALLLRETEDAGKLAKSLRDAQKQADELDQSVAGSKPAPVPAANAARDQVNAPAPAAKKGQKK